MVDPTRRTVTGLLAVAAGLCLTSCGGLPSASVTTPNTRSLPVTGVSVFPGPPASLPPAAQGPAATSEPQPAASQPNKCATAVLHARIEAGDPGAGQRHATVIVTNAGSVTCTLYGYGGFELARSDGKPVPTDLRRVPQPGPTLVRLAPGRSAAKNLSWTVVPTGSEPVDGQCEPEADHAVAIPPDETEPFDLPWSFGPVCAAGRIDGSAYYAS